MLVRPTDHIHQEFWKLGEQGGVGQLKDTEFMLIRHKCSESIIVTVLIM